MTVVGFTGDTSDAAVLQAGREQLGMTYQRLWIDYFALGGNQEVADLESWLTGLTVVPPYEYDLVALALNERFADRGLDHPVPYSKDRTDR